MKLELELSPEVVTSLERLGSSWMLPAGETQEDRLANVLMHIIHCAVAGVRRPGSWERGWVQQAFGEVDDE